MAAAENGIEDRKRAAESTVLAGDFAQFVRACYCPDRPRRMRDDGQTSRRTGLTSFASAWAVQRRVIGALLMREIQARWGRRNLGFAWLFCEPLVFALPVLAMWSLMHHGTNSGVPFLAFMWSGYLPLLMFRHVTGHCLYAVRSGGALFYHRDITPFDVVVARIGLEVIGNLAATALSFYLFIPARGHPLALRPEPVPARRVVHGLVVGFRSLDRRCLERAERNRRTYLATDILYLYADFRLFFLGSVASGLRCASWPSR